MKRNPRTARRGVTVGLAIASIALLTACGTDPGRRLGRRPEAATELGEMEGQVSLLAWPGYVEDGSTTPPSTGSPRSRRTPAARSPPRPSAPPTRR